MLSTFISYISCPKYKNHLIYNTDSYATTTTAQATTAQPTTAKPTTSTTTSTTTRPTTAQPTVNPTAQPTTSQSTTAQPTAVPIYAYTCDNEFNAYFQIRFDYVKNSDVTNPEIENILKDLTNTFFSDDITNSEGADCSMYTDSESTSVSVAYDEEENEEEEAVQWWKTLFGPAEKTADPWVLGNTFVSHVMGRISVGVLPSMRT